MSSLHQTWEEGKDFEVDFWQTWVETKGGDWPDDFKNRMDPNLCIDTHVEDFLKGITGTPNVLDVGAGPLTVLGKKLSNGQTISITAVDPLADQYNQLFRKAGIAPLVETKFAEVEKLDQVFNENTFDLVHMRNALDHSYDPLKGVKQMLHVVKPRRVILLEHSTNEAEKANYGAFHQWNICSENGELIFWNKQVRINVNNELKNYGKVTSWGNDDWTSAVIEKLK